jgi:hypothetical protein
VEKESPINSNAIFEGVYGTSFAPYATKSQADLERIREKNAPHSDRCSPDSSDC